MHVGNRCLVSGVFGILHKEVHWHSCVDWKEHPGRRYRKPQSLRFLHVIELS